MTPTILVIDDNPDVIKALGMLCKLEGMHCISADSPTQGLQILDEQAVDLVIQDMNFTADMTSGEEGKQLFAAIRERHADIPIILLTAWAHLEMAVELVKAGAADYLAKPWDDEKLLLSMKNLLEFHQLQQQQLQRNTATRQRIQQLQQKYDLCGIVFASDGMLGLLETACQVAHADVSVLITGPNGAGKEKIAEVIQANSAVRQAPFIKVNVGALPAELMEAELFGAEPGAYTGSQQRRIGRFEAANGGTLFLDEIGNLSLEGQKKLLRVLETGQFERLGSTQSISVQVRVLSATNADLPAMIQAGRFREDLYYRLNIIELSLPALAQRKDDILPLAQHFLAEGFRFSQDCERLMMQYHWPGNVRELQNCIKRAVLLSHSATLQPDDLGLKLDLKVSRHQADAVNAEEIQQALEQHQYVVAQAAKALGLSRQALYRRMQKFGISAE